MPKEVDIQILLVEDNEVNIQLITHYYNKYGIQWDTARNGKEAIEAFRNKQYDIILMDIQMPIMDGFEATRQIRIIEGDKKHTPIVALTATVMVGVQEECLANGMDDYVSKPIDFKLLWNKIQSFL